MEREKMSDGSLVLSLYEAYKGDEIPYKTVFDILLEVCKDAQISWQDYGASPLEGMANLIRRGAIINKESYEFRD